MRQMGRGVLIGRWRHRSNIWSVSTPALISSSARDANHVFMKRRGIGGNHLFERVRSTHSCPFCRQLAQGPAEVVASQRTLRSWHQAHAKRCRLFRASIDSGIVWGTGRKTMYFCGVSLHAEDDNERGAPRQFPTLRGLLGIWAFSATSTSADFPKFNNGGFCGGFCGATFTERLRRFNRAA